MLLPKLLHYSGYGSASFIVQSDLVLEVAMAATARTAETAVLLR